MTAAGNLPVLSEEQPSALLPAISTAAAGVAAQMKATVESRYLMALQRPRDVEKAREAILAACERPRFAEEASYKLPRGEKSVTGLTVRFAEEVARSWGNLMIDGSVVHEDEDRRIVRVLATDVEANVTYTTDVVIEKTVERSSRAGRTVVSARRNTEDRMVYRVLATDDEVQMKQNSLVSKALRNAVLRFLPADIQEEALGVVTGTVKAEAKDTKKRASAIDRLESAFAGIGVARADLEGFLGHKLEEIDGDELAKLRGYFEAIKEGSLTWQEVARQVPEVRKQHSRAVDSGAGAEVGGEERKGPKPEVKDMATAPRPQGTMPPDPYLHGAEARRQGFCEHGVKLEEECVECREQHGTGA